MSRPDRACPGRAGRPGSLGVAGRGSLISPRVADRGRGSATLRDPANPEGEREREGEGAREGEGNGVKVGERRRRGGREKERNRERREGGE